MVRLKLSKHAGTAFYTHGLYIIFSYNYIMLGVWSCDYNEWKDDAKWRLIECHAPEDLEFAGLSVCAL